MNNTGIIVLAAGASTRLGQLKQLLVFNGKTLLQHIIDEAVQSGAKSIVVVTGAEAGQVSRSIAYTNELQVIINEKWKDGMATSIVAGIKQLASSGNVIRKVIVAVCDQPYVSSLLFQKLNQAEVATGKSIVACAYADTIGTPALFAEQYFHHLMTLKGDEGAKSILRKFKEDVTTIPFPLGKIDIDSPADYESILYNRELK